MNPIKRYVVKPVKKLFKGKRPYSPKGSSKGCAAHVREAQRWAEMAKKTPCLYARNEAFAQAKRHAALAKKCK